MSKPQIKWALIPRPGSTCEQCLGIAAGGFKFSKEFKPHTNCDCDCVAGVEGVTKIQGYDPNEYLTRCHNIREIREGIGATEEQMHLLFERIPIKDALDINPEVFIDNWNHCINACETDEFGIVLKKAATRNPEHFYTGTYPKDYLDQFDKENVHDVEWYQRVRARMEGSRTLYHDLYSTVEDIEGVAERLGADIIDQWHAFKKTGNYASTLGSLIDESSMLSPISAEYGARPEGKELQLARWLSAKGHDIEFLRAGNYPTPDARIDGVPYEFKRTKSARPTKIKQRINEAANQSSHIVLDQSISPLGYDDNLAIAAIMLDDPRVDEIIIVCDRCAIVLKK